MGEGAFSSRTYLLTDKITTMRKIRELRLWLAKQRVISFLLSDFESFHWLAEFDSRLVMFKSSKLFVCSLFDLTMFTMSKINIMLAKLESSS